MTTQLTVDQIVERERQWCFDSYQKSRAWDSVFVLYVDGQSCFEVYDSPTKCKNWFKSQYGLTVDDAIDFDMKVEIEETWIEESFEDGQVVITPAYGKGEIFYANC